MASLTFGFSIPFSSLFSFGAITPSQSSYWKEGILASSAIGLVSTIAFGIFKQSTLILAGVAAVAILAAVYAFRKIQQMEDMDAILKGLHKTQEEAQKILAQKKEEIDRLESI